MQLALPFGLDADRRTAIADPARHLRDLVELVLFTAPGERVNRPEFGCSLLDLAFAGNDDALTTATQFTVQAALQRWLGDRVTVTEVQVEAADEVLRVTVAFQARAETDQRVEVFERAVPR
jgi:phage baseplate assembly protein W